LTSPESVKLKLKTQLLKPLSRPYLLQWEEVEEVAAEVLVVEVLVVEVLVVEEQVVEEQVEEH
jgi:hypothetical protein